MSTYFSFAGFDASRRKIQGHLNAKVRLQDRPDAGPVRSLCAETAVKFRDGCSVEHQSVTRQKGKDLIAYLFLDQPSGAVEADRTGHFRCWRRTWSIAPA
ncbi:MAG: hypothetical protein ACLP7P_15820 [Rhodomicrobium sp.]